MLLWALWFVLSFVDGLRYILIHQYIDQENDRATETHTFVADRQVNIRKYILGLYVVENICCVLLLLPLLREHAWVVALGVAFHVALEFCIYQVLNVYAKKDWMVSFDSVPLEAFLNMILPMMFGICLMKTSLWAGLFSLFILLCCYRALGIKLGIACYTYETNSSAEKKAPNGLPMKTADAPLMNTFDYTNLNLFYKEVQESIALMKEQGANGVILFIHWGNEYQTKQNKTQTAIAQELCDLGEYAQSALLYDAVCVTHGTAPAPIGEDGGVRVYDLGRILYL